MSHELIPVIKTAEENGKLLESTVQNLCAWLNAEFLPDWAVASIRELLEKELFSELNDRFYQYLAFGTGGMRGRTIGAVVTVGETGIPSASGTPEHPSIGCNLLNEYTMVRAVIGLFRYTESRLKSEENSDLPKLVIAHDVRHFSREFCELAASTWSKLGGVALIYDGPRSTPQLSFSVRHLGAHAGVVITASHNPPHDNGFKAYFEDGAQLVPPHDKGVISEVERVSLSDIPEYLEKDVTDVVTLSQSVDEAYLETVVQTVLDRSVFEKSDLKVVFTPIHGTGGIASVPVLKRMGLNLLTVFEQDEPDPQFPTVKSPNPENSEALTLAIELAEREGADIVMATDPDCDRMGVAVRTKGGKMGLLTGNQVGSVLAEYRISKLKELGWIPESGSLSVALIKTFVTSPLQDAIGEGHGIKVINTLTGFKWIGEKIRIYEDELKAELRKKTGLDIDYDATDFRKRCELLQEHSTFYAFGGEESYGYLASDSVRDKDGNSACLIFCELAAALKKEGKTVLDYLDSVYLRYGYYLESLGQIYYEGASGAEKIKNILISYRETPPKSFEGSDVIKFTDFGRETIEDADGKLIPSQDLYFLELANGYSYAVRGSGTEPKIKFYLFAREDVTNTAQLADIKGVTRQRLDALCKAIESDAAARSE
jgi:phosphoglucomutase